MTKQQRESIESRLTGLSKKITRLEDKMDKAEKDGDQEKYKRLDHIQDLSLARFSEICDVLNILGYHVDCNIYTDVCTILDNNY